MPKRKGPKTWAERLADLDNPTPRDIDPEEGDAFAPVSDSNEGSEDSNAHEAREHYEAVGKSKIREPEQLSLGPEYTGATISRHALLSDESDDPFGKSAAEESLVSGSGNEGDKRSDEEDGLKPISDDLKSHERFGEDDIDQPYNIGPKHTTDVAGSNEVTKLGSGSPMEDVETLSQSASDEDSLSKRQGDEDSMTDESPALDSDVSSSSSHSPSLSSAPQPKSSGLRAQVREMMANSHKTVLSNISAAAKADAAKGKAIRKQRSTFDSLLNTRIKLQKALVATNSLAMTSNSSEPSSNDTADTKAIEAAERAALNLWNTIDSLRQTLHRPSTSKPDPPASTTTPTPTLWTRTSAHDTLALPTHRSTLSKWSNKINPAPLLPRAKFDQTSTHQPLTSVLDTHLSGTQSAKHLERARTPRSCAPLQAAKRLTHDGGIYDDADFYTLLLRELVDQRMADPAVSANGAAGNGNGATQLLPGMKDRSLRVKKNVDTKASKGRKMRYTVHEKLQNFMAPEDRGMWGERQRGELFAGLLGRRVEMGEGSGSEGEENEGMDIDMNGKADVAARREEEALMLFRR